MIRYGDYPFASHGGNTLETNPSDTLMRVPSSCAFFSVLQRKPQYGVVLNSRYLDRKRGFPVETLERSTGIAFMYSPCLRLTSSCGAVIPIVNSPRFHSYRN